MPLERKLVDSIEYRGRKIECRLLQPDLIGYIDGVEMPHFYRRSEDIYRIAKREIDAIETEKEKLMKQAGGSAKQKATKTRKGGTTNEF